MNHGAISSFRMIRTRVEWGILGSWRFSPTEGSPRLNRGLVYSRYAVGFNFSSVNTSLTIKRPPWNRNHWFDSQSERSFYWRSTLGSGRYHTLDHGIIGQYVP